MRVLRARLYERKLAEQAAEIAAERALAGRHRRALREDPHLQLPPGPRHRPPGEADRPEPRRDPGRPPREFTDALAAEEKRALLAAQTEDRRLSRRCRRASAGAKPSAPRSTHCVRRGVDSAAARRRAAPGRGLGRTRARPRRRRRSDRSTRRAGRSFAERGPPAPARASRWPTSSGARAFATSSSRSTRRVLIPRPETELLVELALEPEADDGPRRRDRLRRDRARGRGRAARGAMSWRPTSTGSARGRRRRTPTRLGSRSGCASRPARCRATGAFDLVLANLPYVSARDWLELEPELRDSSPAARSRRGRPGLRRSRRCSASCLVVPLQVDAIGLEVGEGQRSLVAELVRRAASSPWSPRRSCGNRARWSSGAGRERPSRRGRRRRARARSWSDDRRRRGRGFPRRRPLRVGLRSAASRRHRAAPRAEGPRRRQALGGVVLLAADPARAARQPRRAHQAALAALLPGPVTVVVHNPERRYPLACRADPERLGTPADRGARSPASATPALPDLGEPQRGAGAGSFEDVPGRDRRGRRPRDRRRRADRRALDRGRRRPGSSWTAAGGSCGRAGCRRPRSASAWLDV